MEEAKEADHVVVIEEYESNGHEDYPDDHQAQDQGTVEHGTCSVESWLQSTLSGDSETTSSTPRVSLLWWERHTVATGIDHLLNSLTGGQLRLLPAPPIRLPPLATQFVRLFETLQMLKDVGKH